MQISGSDSFEGINHNLRTLVGIQLNRAPRQRHIVLASSVVTCLVRCGIADLPLTTLGSTQLWEQVQGPAELQTAFLLIHGLFKSRQVFPGVQCSQQPLVEDSVERRGVVWHALHNPPPLKPLSKRVTWCAWHWGTSDLSAHKRLAFIQLTF